MIMQKIITFFLVLFVFGVFYLFSFILLGFIDDNTPNSMTPFIRNNFKSLWFASAIVFTIAYVICYYNDNKDFNEFTGKLLLIVLISCLIAVLLVYIFGNGPYWFLKYLIGCFVGSLFNVFIQIGRNRQLNFVSGITAIFVHLFGEQIEYFLLMDSSDYPTVLSIKSFTSLIFWLLAVIVVFFSAYFFSNGFWKKNKGIF